MKKYNPQILRINPNEIIPYHGVLSRNEGMLRDYLNDKFVPYIPVVRAPEELRKFGNFVNYNGHHRTDAAREAAEIRKDFLVPTILLDSQRDLDYLVTNPPVYRGEVYPELLEALDDDFDEHRNFVISEAKKYMHFLELRDEKIRKGLL